MEKGQMTQEHKNALAKGRRQAKAVRKYLKALHQRRKPGRPVDRESLEARIDKINAKIGEETDPPNRVELIQQRLDAEEQLAELEDQPDFEELEAGFVDVVKDYSERKNISYSAWREEGVPAAVLRKAGIAQTRRPSTSRS